MTTLINRVVSLSYFFGPFFLLVISFDFIVSDAVVQVRGGDLVTEIEALVREKLVRPLDVFLSLSLSLSLYFHFLSSFFID